MPLTSQQKRDFARQGFLHVPGMIPRDKIDEAMMHINHWLGHAFDPSQIDTYTKQSYCPELREQPPIKNLMEDTAVYAAAEELTAPGSLKPTWRGQIALRFPKPGAQPKRMGGHIDGTPGDNNGVPPGTIYSFTMLVGIALSDVDREWAGNFTVWPGSHLKLENWFKEHSLYDLLETGLPKLDYGPPQQMQWKAGDVVFAHHQTVHGIATNLSPNIRYATFFRLHHVEHDALREEVVRDIWREYDGVRQAIAGA